VYIFQSFADKIPAFTTDTSSAPPVLPSPNDCLQRTGTTLSRFGLQKSFHSEFLVSFESEDKSSARLEHPRAGVLDIRRLG